MTMNHPLVNRYVSDFNNALPQLAPAERAEVVSEIRQHIDDAMAAGRPIDEVLQALGSVEALARAYQLELLVTPRTSAAPVQPRSDRWLKIMGLLALGSLPTFIIVIVLGTIGLSFTVTGVALVAAGIADSAGALPVWVRSDIAPWLAVVSGVALTILGLLSSWGTIAYLRFVGRLVRRVVPSRASATV